MAIAVQVFGKTSVKHAYPGGTAALVVLGEATDMITPQQRVFFHNVPGDAHGGPQGPPIEVQYLGQMIVAQIQMSQWDSTEANKLTKRHLATEGTILDAEIGVLMLLTRSHRFTFVNTSHTLNVPCCIIREPQEHGRGTKWSEMNITFEGHRAPPTHPKAGILYNNDGTNPV